MRHRGVEEAACIFTKIGAEAEIMIPSGRRGGRKICLAVVGTAGMLHAGWKVAQNVWNTPPASQPDRRDGP
jgi:molybdenum transport protein